VSCGTPGARGLGDGNYDFVHMISG
jgi:hypothetical protein